MCPYNGISPSASKQEQDYRGEDDHRTLTRAAEITGDQDRMKGVRKHHQKQTRALKKVGRAIGGKR